MKKLSLLLFGLAIGALPCAAQHHQHAPAATTLDSILEQQILTVRRATERYLDHANAEADGYRRFGADGPLMGEHWYHPELVKGALDLARPATLQYAVIDGKRTLVGVAYNVYQEPGEPLPEGFKGSADVWHVHDVPKMARAFVEDRPFLRWVVNRRIAQGKVGAGGERTQLVMLHAWIWSDNPDGIFAQQHRALPYLRAGLPADWARNANDEAAWGAALLRDGCSFELQKLEKLARTTKRQQSEFRASCDRAAAQVREASRTDAATFNSTVSRAWREFAETRDRSLTAEQKRRLGSVVEPMHPH